MKRDPFYQKIVSGLSRPLDPELFERCVADILRSEWPTLVPVRGGADAGMDGAVGDGQGTAFPLICTTGEDVIGNLTRSLTSYVNHGGERRSAILATSQELTSRRRQNLEKRAKEKGFTLQQIYTQSAIADRLYRNEVWCRELLNLNGAPPALSTIPSTSRPLVDIPMIGRVEDLNWLLTQPGDRLLVGQPGCGKTFLLQEVTKCGGLFVISRNRTEIAVELRSQVPAILIVDDAHLDLTLLAELQQLRREMGLTFDLVACSWPGQQLEVAQALNVSEAQTRTLPLLARDQILAVIKTAGIFGPDELLRELVDQAEGKPGLAVTLAHLCLHGGVQEVALGDALSRSINAAFTPLIGQHASDLLAGFSVGGSVGMMMQTVAELSGQPLAQVRRDMARMAAGGVVQQLSDDRLTVRPDGLRHALVRDLFFPKSVPLPIQPFIDKAPDIREAVRTLIGARSRGGAVPDDLLLPLLSSLNTSAPWEEYAALGQTETAFVLRHLDKIESVAGPALHYLPEDALSQLLDAAGSATSTSDRSMTLIREWIRTAKPGSGEAVRRRRLVIRQIKGWLGPLLATRNSSDPEKPQIAAAQAIASALSPRFEHTTTDPGLGNTITLSRGLLTMAEILEMESVWEGALDVLPNLPAHHLNPIIKSIQDWVYPARHALTEIPVNQEQAMKLLARRMIDDLAPLTIGHPGLTASLNRVARPLEYQPAVTEDPTFSVLFPARSHANWHESEKIETEAVQGLAALWVNQAPEKIATRLSRYEQEADGAGLTWPRHTLKLSQELANQVSSPKKWAQAFCDARLSPNFTRPFLERAVSIREEGWEALLRVTLTDPNQRGTAVFCILMLPAPPSDLFDEMLTVVGDFPLIVNQACLRDEVPASTIRRLLLHQNPFVAAAAATGLWSATPHGKIPDELQPEWRSAILRIKHDDYALSEMLSDNRTLLMDWLKVRLNDEHDHYFYISDSLQTVVAGLSEVERISLLPLIPNEFGVEELLGWLVGDSPTVYAALLATPHLRSRHLSPLGRYTETRAHVMTLQAIDAGYDVSAVAQAFIPSHWSWSRSISAMWQEWLTRLDRLGEQSEDEKKDPRLVEVAQAARTIFQQYRDQAQVQEHAEAVYGRK